MDERKAHKKNVQKLKTKKPSGNFYTAISKMFSGSKKSETKSVLKPTTIQLNKLKNSVEAYRGSIANLFTSNDPTITPQGWVRLFTDTGYYGDVQKCLTIYQRDDLIGGLVDALANSANSKLNFDLPSNNQDEAEVWNQWAKLVNIDAKGGLPGLGMLNEKIFRSMIVTGMAVVDIEWGNIKNGRKVYEFPTKITLYPTLGIKLQASTTNYGEEDVILGISDAFYKSTLSNASDDVAIQTLFTDWDDKGKKAMKRNNAYAIKFRHTPNNQTLYPNPMINRSMESIALRHKLMDADISTLEIIINKIIQIKVGDKDHPPMPASYDENGNLLQDGDIELAQELFESLEDEVEVIATPYNYDIDVVTPDTTVLLNSDKYTQAIFNIYANFGIFLDPNANSNSSVFEKLNLKNYEKNAMDLQAHAAGWYLWLAGKIIQRNKGSLKALPMPTFDRPDVYTDNYLSNLLDLYKIGGSDIFTVLEKYGLDPDKVRERKIIQNENEELWEAPATFKQQVVEGGKTKEVSSQHSEGAPNKSKGESK
ncbi:MAG: hypothetical protein PHN69_04105 [Candidatus Pacebacteria bacterium]|nr:hypothetical protein [Candidatus Paceibacterota bacterium]